MIKQVIAFLFILSTAVQPICAQELGAHVVIKQMTNEVEIISSKESHQRESYTVEIRSNEHKYANYFLYFPYSEGNNKINKLTCRVYDAYGRELLRLKKKDFQDNARYDNISLITDARALYYHIPKYRTPYTMEISVESTQKYAMNYSWYPVVMEKCALQNASYTLIAPADMKMNISTQHVAQATAKQENGTQLFQWSIKDFDAIQRRFALETKMTSLLPFVRVVPDKFQYDDTEGAFSSWASFGQWIYALGSDSRELPADAQNEIRDLVDDTMSLEDKICTLYSYMQDRTRYVSIQLGIGGWKPFTAAFVHEKQYGDCKALSNYMQAILAVADIPSYYTIISAGAENDGSTTRDFPNNSFNHAVLLVPVDQDTILLECTSQTSPCGFQSRFTDNRLALMIDDGHSRLIKTRGFDEAQNFRRDSAVLQIDAEGSANIDLKRLSSGILADNFHLMDVAEKEKVNRFSQSVTFGQFDTKSYESKICPSGAFDVDVEENAIISSQNFITKSGNRLFVPLQALQEIAFPELPDSIRHSFSIDRGFSQQIALSVQIPAGYQVENIELEKNIESRFGEYSRTVETNSNGNLHINRSYTAKKGMFDVQDYTDYKSFTREVKKAENENIVLIGPQ